VPPAACSSVDSARDGRNQSNIQHPAMQGDVQMLVDEIRKTARSLLAETEQ
jgi:hypothetical protein